MHGQKQRSSVQAATNPLVALVALEATVALVALPAPVSFLPVSFATVAFVAFPVAFLPPAAGRT